MILQKNELGMADSTPIAKIQEFADDERRWQAIVERDRAADKVFYYAVRTTGVYCRPSCAARLPKRENVAFYTTCEQAERVGYRACKRCRPKDASLDARHRDAVTSACRLMEDADEIPSLAEMAKHVGMSRYYFRNVFTKIMGVTPRVYAASRRAQRIRDVLAKGRPVTEAIYGAGFNSNGRFYASSIQHLGMTPTAYRAGGHGMTIRFAVGACSLGSVLVAATDKGICAIFLGDDPEALVRDLQDRFTRARLVGGDAAFDEWVAIVVGFVEKPAVGLGLPLDIRGTAFQVRVWEALCAIPPGLTTNYAAIAERIGRPKAVRAVAQACAANPIAVAIPCHRAVRTDQSLSGYRWGVERKAELLKREGVAI